jgi:hypothetical protein
MEIKVIENKQIILFKSIEEVKDNQFQLSEKISWKDAESFLDMCHNKVGYMVKYILPDRRTVLIFKDR